MQLVDISPARNVLRLPHPLLADYVDFHRTVGCAGEMEEELRAPDEHDHRDPKRDDRPEELERDRAVDGVADLIVVCAVELRREDGEKDRDERREDGGDGDQEEIDGVDLRGLLGRLLRKERKI